MDEVHIDGLRVPELAERGYQAWTGTRFCRCTGATADNPDDRERCIDRQLDDTGECGIGDTATYDQGPEARTWRWVSLDYVSPNLRGATPRLRHSEPRTEVLSGYDSPEGAPVDARGYWNQDADLTRWAAAPLLDSVAFGAGTSMPGVLWTHTPGDISGPLGTDRTFDAATRALASHYWSGPVAGPIELPAPFPCFNWIGPLVGTSPFCPSCSASFPTPWLGVPGTLGFGGGCGPLPEPPWLHVPTGIIELGPVVRGDPAELFGGIAGVWLAASEPDPWLPKTGLRYVALGPSGREIERTLVLGLDGRLGIPLEEPNPCQRPGGCDPLPLPLPCDEPNGCAAFSTGAAPISDAAPEPPLAVFSARRQLVWVIDGNAAGAVRIIDLRANASREAHITGDVELGRALAATYSPVHDVLFILVEDREVARSDRRRGPEPARARLLRLDALGGALQVVGEWPRVANTQRFGMASGPSGALWIAASGDGHAPHAVVRMDVGARPAQVVGFQVGPGVLRSAAIRATQRGISLVVTDTAGRDELVGYETSLLRPAGPPDARRWF